MRLLTHRRASFAAVALAALLTATGAQAATITVSPLAGTRDASPQSQISFLGASASDLHDVSVVGSQSGAHSGRLESYTSATGASFLPYHPFIAGEHVTATAQVGRRFLTSAFTIARQAGYDLSSPPPSTREKPAPSQHFVSQPALQPPPVSIMVDSPQAAPGDLFMTFAHGAGQSGPMIVDGAGRLVWFKPAPKGTTATDFQVERYRSKPVLVWWQGQIPSLGVGFGRDEIYDSKYRPVAQITGGNGYEADLHDVQITPAGSAFTTADTLVHADLASAGGPHEGVLIDSIVQEIDIGTGLVMFEWHSYGHVALSDSYTTPHFSSSEPWDYFHLNSVDRDPDGNLLISARNTSAVYDVSTATGRVLWRLGGRHSSFKMDAGTGTAWQHDARWQADHTITIFDDGAVPKRHSQSRAIRLAIDWAHRTVHLADRYVHAPGLLSGSQGSEQVLPNGDSFVGWGEVPYFTEFTPSGQMVLDGRMPFPAQSYRTYKFPWSASPTEPPAIAVKPAGDETDTVYASWNGATSVSEWRVLAGASAASLSPIASAPRSGFESAIPVPRATHFAVQAFDASGRLLGVSGTVTVTAGS